jgi:hypothetical protein
VNHRLSGGTGNVVDKVRYQRLVGRLIYLSHTNIAFAVGVLSQFMHAPYLLFTLAHVLVPLDSLPPGAENTSYYLREENPVAILAY